MGSASLCVPACASRGTCMRWHTRRARECEREGEGAKEREGGREGGREEGREEGKKGERERELQG